MSNVLVARFPTRPVARRTRDIAKVLAGHGLGTLVDQTGLTRFLPRFHRPEPERPRLSQAQRLRLALGELGVSFTKLGQTLSTRADLLPADIIAELSKLQDSAPCVPLAAVERVIIEDFGAPPDGIFARFDPTPMASASIGQVHAATLRDGREVVVKVRRPGIVEQVDVDLEILRSIVDWVQQHTAMGEDYDLHPVVDEFAYTLHDELDYVREAQNAVRFRRAFADDPGIHIPRVHEDYSTHRVLTLERVTGIKISDVEALDRQGISRRAVAENAVRSFLREVLEFGFFHADPHPGNYFVQPDGSLAIVDFGMIGRVSEVTQNRLLRAGLAALHQDSEALAEELYALGVAGRRAQRAAFQKDLDHLIGHYGGYSLSELSARVVVEELVRVVFRHKLQLPAELALLLRVSTMSEGVGLSLDPAFHYFDYASPIFRSSWKQRRSLSANLERLGRTASDAAELGIALPRRLDLLLGRLERGEMQMTVQHRGLDRVTREFQRMTNRLALSVILAASVVAVGIAAGVRREVTGDPVLAWLLRLGLVFSVAFGFSVIWGIWRAGRR